MPPGRCVHAVAAGEEDRADEGRSHPSSFAESLLQAETNSIPRARSLAYRISQG
jgi:hypothetical protein